jgi:hypothetical protein
VLLDDASFGTGEKITRPWRDRRGLATRSDGAQPPADHAFVRTTKPKAASTARIGAALARRKRAELLELLRPCFARTGPWLQAGKYAAAVMSQIPRRNGWTIAAQAGHQAPDKTQRLLSRAVWDTFAAACGAVTGSAGRPTTRKARDDRARSHLSLILRRRGSLTGATAPKDLCITEAVRGDRASGGARTVGTSSRRLGQLPSAGCEVARAGGRVIGAGGSGEAGVVHGDGHLYAVGRVQLGQDAGYVGLDGCLAHVQVGGDV